MQLDEQRLRFRDAMASLSAAVNIITTEGDADNAGLRQRLSARSRIHHRR